MDGESVSPKLPGWGLPVDEIPEAHFPSALLNHELGQRPPFMRLITLREFNMVRLMNQLTDKPNWDVKIFDDSIVSKWEAETLAHSGIDFSVNMFRWCIDELRYKAGIYQRTGAITVFDGDVVKSDKVVPEEIRYALKRATKCLEDVPEIDQDWHPGSDKKVLDLVHPSLFPLVYGRSRIIEGGLVGMKDCISRCGHGVILPKVPASLDLPSAFGRDFQWLPCNVKVLNGVKILSYINNLHPQKHSELYEVIEQIIDKAIPLWDMTLTPLQASSYSEPRIPYLRCKREGESELSDCESDLDESQSSEDEIRGPLIQPEPEDFALRVLKGFRGFDCPESTIDSKGNPKINLRNDFGAQGLQIIVKLANIHLTPDNPTYEGGVWHVEGQLNEHICATALYYYDSHNITESRLSFRQRASRKSVRDIYYEQGDHEWISAIFGCENQGSTVQEIGSVATPQGRLLTFPNILQHRVEPFTLADPVHPGHRKILALFLVDPNIPIISTANVPCQQRHWWSEQVGSQEGRPADLPAEIFQMIVDRVDDFPIGKEEAEEMRLRLMAERTAYVDETTEEFEGEEISLCEH